MCTCVCVCVSVCACVVCAYVCVFKLVTWVLEAAEQKLISNCTSTFSVGKYCGDQSRNVDMSVAVQDKVCGTCLCASEHMSACGDGSCII